VAVADTEEDDRDYTYTTPASHDYARLRATAYDLRLQQQVCEHVENLFETCCVAGRLTFRIFRTLISDIAG